MTELYPASDTVFYRAGKIAQRNSKHTQAVDYLQCALAVNYGGEFIADRRAHRFPELLRHETRRRARRDPVRFQHQYLARPPRGLQQRQRHLRGLARTRRRFEH